MNSKATQRKDDFSLILAIARRAKPKFEEAGVEFDMLSICMDIEYAHAYCPLNLTKFLNADDGNFGHDIAGIYNNLNRQSKKLDNCFHPRFASSNHPA